MFSFDASRKRQREPSFIHSFHVTQPVRRPHASLLPQYSHRPNGKVGCDAWEAREAALVRYICFCSFWKSFLVLSSWPDPKRQQRKFCLTPRSSPWSMFGDTTGWAQKDTLA